MESFSIIVFEKCMPDLSEGIFLKSVGEELQEAKKIKQHNGNNNLYTGLLILAKFITKNFL